MICLSCFNLEFGRVACEVIFFLLSDDSSKIGTVDVSLSGGKVCEFNVGLEIQFDFSLWAVCGADWVCVIILKSVLMSGD